MGQHSFETPHNVRIAIIDSREGLRREIERVGVDPKVLSGLLKKAERPVILIDNVKNVCANIIKQEMIASGGDAALSRGSINHSVDLTGMALLGNIKNYLALIKKLKRQPFRLPLLSSEIDSALKRFFGQNKIIRCGDYSLNLKKKTYVMGILNITPDSFYDGGKYCSIDMAYARAEQMVDEGADIIDIGAESTRPGSLPVEAKEEKRRILPVLKRLAKAMKVPVSVDTYKADVAEAALGEGASIINDISGLTFDNNMAEVVSRYNSPVVLMHIKGKPKTMQDDLSYNDLMGEIAKSLSSSINNALNAGVDPKKIVIDPGIGFGKSCEDNLNIVGSISQLCSLGMPVMVGISRKSFIGSILKLPPQDRLEGTLAAVSVAVFKGADIIRSHDVKETVRAALIARRLRKWS